MKARIIPRLFFYIIMENDKDLEAVLNKFKSLMEDSKLEPEEKVPESEEEKFTITAPIRTTYYNSGDFGVVNETHLSGHKGVDLRAPRGTPIYSIGEGTVKYAGDQGIGGLAVTILHPDGFKSYYAHLDSIKCKNGQKVTSETIIGTLGDTGNAKGRIPHLHFQLWKDNSLVNPAKYFYVPKYTNVSKAEKYSEVIEIINNLVKLS